VLYNIISQDRVGILLTQLFPKSGRVHKFTNTWHC